MRWAGTEVLDHYEQRPPQPTNGLAAFAGSWDSRFPGALADVTGNYGAFEDPRIERGVAALGGIEGFSVLELGPWEGGHTWMLEQRGAAAVLAIESNSRGYLKCLVTQQVMGLERSRFLCGDFAPYLRHTQDHFDIVVACGVLYHQLEPAEMLADLGRVTDRVLLWTHYFSRDRIEASPRSGRASPPSPSSTRWGPRRSTLISTAPSGAWVTSVAAPGGRATGSSVATSSTGWRRSASSTRRSTPSSTAPTTATALHSWSQPGSDGLSLNPFTAGAAMELADVLVLASVAAFPLVVVGIVAVAARRSRRRREAAQPPLALATAEDALPLNAQSAPSDPALGSLHGEPGRARATP